MATRYLTTEDDFLRMAHRFDQFSDLAEIGAWAGGYDFAAYFG